MHLTIANKETTRLRMLHLIHREAAGRSIISEDGVMTATARRVDVDFFAPAPVDETLTEEDLKKNPYDPSLMRPPTRIALFDGEVYPIPSVSTLVVKPSPLKVRIVMP